MDLAGKSIVVTGASSGLGRAICSACAKAGARVILVARHPERLAEAARECGEGKHLVFPADLSDLDAIPRLVRAISKETGPLSGVVHSAGLHQPAPLRAVNAKHLEAIFQLNAIAGVMLVKGLAAQGVHADSASAVLLSSVLGRVGQPGAIGYCMSKGALEQAVKVMALELAGERIRVNCIAPAVIETPMTREFFGVIGQAAEATIRGQHPSGLGRPEDVAGAAVYLLSDASRFVTGTSILVDGGYCAR